MIHQRATIESAVEPGLIDKVYLIPADFPGGTIALTESGHLRG